MYTKFTKFARLYQFHILGHFTTKLCNFTKFRTLFQDVVIFLPVSNYLKISSERFRACLHEGRVTLVEGLPQQTGQKKASVYMR